MSTGLLLIRTSRRNVLCKASNHTVRVSGQPDQQLSEQQPDIQYNLPSGRYTVEVSDEHAMVSNDVVVLVGKPRIVKVYPAMGLAAFRGFLIGSALVVLAVQLFFQGEFSPVFLPFLIPLLLFWNRNDSQEFLVRVSR